MKLSLRDSLRHAWKVDRRLRFYDLEGMTESMTFGEFGEKVSELQAGLEALGVGPGSVVAVMGPTSPSIVALCAAVWQAEATLTVLATPTRLSNLEQYLAETLGKALGELELNPVLLSPNGPVAADVLLRAAPNAMLTNIGLLR